MAGAVVLVMLGAALVFGFIGVWVAGQKGRNPVEGFLLGALFAVFGLLLEASLPTGPDAPTPKGTPRR